MRLESAAFADGEQIPQRHGKRFENVSPPLSWSDVPAGTRSFALSVVDRISPGNVYLHWLVTDIPPSASSLAEGASGTPRMPAGSREPTPYVGPFPPSGVHTYTFTLYALDAERLEVRRGSLEGFEAAVDGRALATATLSGRFPSSAR
jgi:Raf kinase inhibitor-like YbhB/YbcL family protein